jgi:hypothetical protein
MEEAPGPRLGDAGYRPSATLDVHAMEGRLEGVADMDVSARWADAGSRRRSTTSIR